MELNGAWAHAAVCGRLTELSGQRASEHHSARAEAAVQLQALADEPGIPLVAMNRHFELDDPERQLVGLMLAQALDSELGALLAQLNGVPDANYLTPHAAAEVLAEGSMSVKLQLLSALSPDAKLRIIRVLDEAPFHLRGLTLTPLRLTRACVSFLVDQAFGSPYHKHLEPPAQQLPTYTVFPEAERNRIYRVVRAHASALVNGDWRVSGGAQGMLLLLWGPPGVGKKTLARELAYDLFGAAVELDAVPVSTSEQPLRNLSSAFDAAVIRQAALIVDNGEALLQSGPGAHYLLRCVETCSTCVIVTAATRDLAPCLDARWAVRTRMSRPSRTEERVLLWEAHIPPDVALEDDVDVGILADRYPLSGSAIGAAARTAVAIALSVEAPLGMAHLDESASLTLDSDMGGLVREVQPRNSLSDLVLPSDQLDEVQRIIAAKQTLSTVLSRWGFGRKYVAGPCISCLFQGEPGTGKTFSAEVIAASLEKPLFIVSLPGVLSKWMGETERNLVDLFTRAAVCDALLLFDEADALFARRVEGSTSQDHARNMLTGLLLQELERHRGLVILTTNLAKNIDPAFERRIMFNLEFPLPDVEARRRILERLLPSELAHDELNLHALAHEFELSGGHLKNALLRAALCASDEGSVLTQKHLQSECVREYRKLGRVYRMEKRS